MLVVEVGAEVDGIPATCGWTAGVGGAAEFKP